MSKSQFAVDGGVVCRWRVAHDLTTSPVETKQRRRGQDDVASPIKRTRPSSEHASQHASESFRFIESGGVIVDMQEVESMQKEVVKAPMQEVPEELTADIKAKTALPPLDPIQTLMCANTSLVAFTPPTR